MTRKTKQISATALSDVDVTWISLVQRGANRQPIKIHKSEGGNQMNTGTQSSLDLAQIGARAIKGEDAGNPTIIAAIVKKGEGERISELFKDVEGLEVVSVSKDEENGCDMINFVKDAQMDESCIAFKHDDNVVFIVSGVKASTCKMDFWANSTSFKDNIQKTSFFPNLREASYTLVDTIANIVYGDDDAEVATKSEAEINAFGEYVKALVSALPVTVAKSLQKINFEPAAKTEEAPTGTPEDTVVDSGKEGEDATVATKTEEAEKTAKSEGQKEEAEKTEGDDETVKDGKEEPEDTAKTEEAPAWALELVSKVDKLGERLEQVETNAANAVQKAEEAAKVTNESKALVDKAENILTTARGTVNAQAEAEEELPVQTAKTEESDNTLHEAGIELY